MSNSYGGSPQLLPVVGGVITSPGGVDSIGYLAVRPSNNFVLFGDSITEMHKGFTVLTPVTDYYSAGNLGVIKRGASSGFMPNSAIRLYKTANPDWVGTKRITNLSASSLQFSKSNGSSELPVLESPHTQLGVFLPYHNSDRGWFWWANASVGNRAYVQNVSAVGGDRTANLLARIHSTELGVTPFNPSFCTVMIGINDLNADLTASYVIDNLEKIYTILLQAGVHVIAMTILPVATGHFKAGNEAHSQAIMTVNEWIKRKATSTRGMTLCDSCAAVVDPVAVTFTTLSGMLQSDGIHLTQQGARAVGSALAPILSSLLPRQNTLPVSTRESYGVSSTNTNLCDNPLMTGSGGTAGTGVSGTIPASYQVERIGGSATCVCAVVARTVLADGDALGNNAELTITGTANNDLIAIRNLTSIHGRLADGDLITFECALKWSGASGIKSIRVLLQSSDGTYFWQAEAIRNSDTTYDASDFSGVFKTAPMRFHSSMTTLHARVYVTFSGVGAIVLSTGRWCIRKMAVPEVY